MEKKILTVREMYQNVYEHAWYYYAIDAYMSDDQVRKAATIFAVKHTWDRYNKYLRRLKEKDE